MRHEFLFFTLESVLKRSRLTRFPMFAEDGLSGMHDFLVLPWRILRPNSTDLGSARRQPYSLDAGTRTTDLHHLHAASPSIYSLLPVIHLPSASNSGPLDETIRITDPFAVTKRQLLAEDAATREPGDSDIKGALRMHMHLSDSFEDIWPLLPSCRRQRAISIKVDQSSFQCNLRTPASHNVRPAASVRICTHFCSKSRNASGNGSLVACVSTGK
jgi:hypothetical protein